ncbi:MAG: glycosyltransferase family 2 protein [Ignavibacteria bacterium]
MILFVAISILPLINLMISVYNLFTAPRLAAGAPEDQDPLVSILIPARNEEDNIGDCLKLLMMQSYSNIEIFVLDDNSNDSTFESAMKAAEEDKRINIIKGKELPDNWLGKTWACKQLSENASGEYLLFIDADVRLMENAVGSTLTAMDKYNTDMLSVFPKQITKTFGEKLIVPVLYWFFISFLPVRKVYTSKRDRYSAANGQFMLWKRDAYFNSGGHESVRDKIVEDLELGKFLKTKGYKTIILIGYKLVECRMYKGFKEAIAGFNKNAYAASELPGWQHISYITILTLSYLLPLILVFQKSIYLYLIAVILIQRVIVSLIGNQNILMNVILYPAHMIMFFYIGMKSYISFRRGELYWKERKV